MDMAKACLKHDAAFGVCLIREGEEVGAPAVPESVGCLARIGEWDMETLGILKVKVEGLERFRLVSTTTTPPGLILGDIERFAAGGGGAAARARAERRLRAQGHRRRWARRASRSPIATTTRAGSASASRRSCRFAPT